MFVRQPGLSDHRLGTDPFMRQTRVGIRNCMPMCRLNATVPCASSMGDRVIFRCPVSRKAGVTTPVGLVNSVSPWQVEGTGTGRIFQQPSEHE